METNMMRNILILLTLLMISCTDSSQNNIDYSDALPLSELDSLLSGKWEVHGFQPSTEQPFYAGYLILNDARYEFKPSTELEEKSRNSLILTDWFFVENQRGVVECKPIITESEFKIFFGNKDLLIAQCIFYSDSKSSREHSVNLSGSKILYFNESKPDTIHLGTITKQLEN